MNHFSQLLILVCMTECRRLSRILSRGRKWRAVRRKRRHQNRRLPARRRHKRFPTCWRGSLRLLCGVLHGNQWIQWNYFAMSKGPMMPKMPQMDLIAELKKRQVKPQVREGKDGVLEDIITGRNTSRWHAGKGWQKKIVCPWMWRKKTQNPPETHFARTPPSDLKNTPYRRTDGRRPAQRQDTWAHPKKKIPLELTWRKRASKYSVQLHEHTISRTTRCMCLKRYPVVNTIFKYLTFFNWRRLCEYNSNTLWEKNSNICSIHEQEKANAALWQY